MESRAEMHLPCVFEGLCPWSSPLRSGLQTHLGAKADAVYVWNTVLVVPEHNISIHVTPRAKSTVTNLA